MIARFAALFTLCLLITGAAMAPVAKVSSARELQAASRLARDADLQGDWNKLLDARARLERLVQRQDIAAVVHYQLGYLEWRLSSLVYMSTGFRGQVPHWRRAVSELEQAVALRPDLCRCPRAHRSVHDPSPVERSEPSRSAEAPDRDRVEGRAGSVAHEPSRAAASRHDRLQHTSLVGRESTAGSRVVARGHRSTGEGADDQSSGS